MNQEKQSNSRIEKPLEQLLAKAIAAGFSYQEYRELVSNLAKLGKSTGPMQTDDLTKYTQLNDARMKRWDKTLKITETIQSIIKSLNKPVAFIVLTESWCGDAAPSLPVFNKIAEHSSHIDLHIVLRDENLELMQNFLTNKALSIPKLILWDPSLQSVIATWGPRPKGALQMVTDFMEKHGELTAAFRELLQLWYNKDKGKSIVNEVVELLPLK